MKKWIAWLLILMVALMVPMIALAEDAQAVTFDWTALVVAIIGAIATALSTLLARVWMRYVKPWLEQRKLTEAAQIVVDAVEALLGRYCGAEKWKLALQKMDDRGFHTNSEQVLDALKAAWNKLDISQIEAGVKAADDGEDRQSMQGE